MNECAKISVVMPVYNVEKYLQEAVESVLYQTYSNWELILVDDGSTDSSGEMCDAWTEKDERIQVVHTPNRGLSHARNTGLARATGEWVIFPDSDDRLDARTLEIMLSYTDDVDVVICMLETFPEKQVFQAVEKPVWYETFADTAPDFHYLHSRDIFSSACTKLYRRAHIKMCFDENVRHMEDVMFNMEHLPTCRGIRIIPHVLYQYRREPVMTLSKRFWQDTLQLHKRELNAFLDLFPRDEQIREMLLRRHKLYIMQWIYELTQLKNIDRETKKMLLELYLPDALDVPQLKGVRGKGISRFLWWCVESGNNDLILTVVHWGFKVFLKSGSVKS